MMKNKIYLNPLCYEYVMNMFRIKMEDSKK